jgi:hypothetical protein
MATAHGHRSGKRELRFEIADIGFVVSSACHPALEELEPGLAAFSSDREPAVDSTSR